MRDKGTGQRFDGVSLLGRRKEAKMDWKIETRKPKRKSLNTKIYYYLIFSAFSFLLFSCSKNDEEDVWARHIDMTSDIIIFIPDIQMYTSAEKNQVS